MKTKKEYRLIDLWENPHKFSYETDVEKTNLYDIDQVLCNTEELHVKIKGLRDCIVLTRMPLLSDSDKESYKNHIEEAMEEFFCLYFLQTRARKFEVDFTTDSPGLSILTLLDDQSVANYGDSNELLRL